MAKQQKGLGNTGLTKLLHASRGAPVETKDQEENTRLMDVPVDLLQRGKYQPRREMDSEALEELAASIGKHGVIQPLVIRSVDKNRYEIIAGERRWRAAQLAGLSTVPAVLQEVSDEDASAFALIENIQREDLNPIEEALAYQRLKDDFGMNQQQLADAIGKSRTSITNQLRLLKLSDDVKRLLENGDIETGHAKVILGLEAESQQTIAATQVVDGQLSVRQTEELVRRLTAPSKASASNERNADVLRLETQIAEKIGAPVTISHSANGKGKLSISYNNLDQLDGIIAHIK